MPHASVMECLGIQDVIYRVTNGSTEGYCCTKMNNKNDLREEEGKKRRKK